MKLYLRIIYGWLQKDSTGIDELEQALTDSLKTFGFEHMEISQLPVTKGLLNHFAPPAKKLESFTAKGSMAVLSFTTSAER